jgi:hypothetical protein
MIHDEHCPRYPSGYYVYGACREFSTDGTRVGAEIAHAMGTTDEDEITMMALSGDKRYHLTGVFEEQADWDGDDE